VKRVLVSMEYVGKSEAEFVVPDDLELKNLGDLSSEQLRELDDGLVENSPSDWSAEVLEENVEAEE